MSAYVPNFEHMRHALLFMYNQGKKVSESHRALVEVYGDRALTLRTCETWFRQFKHGDFDLNDAARSGKRKSFDDAELQALLDEDDTQTQRQLAEALGVQQQAISKRLRAMGKIQKCGKWVPHELTERQMENRKVTCEMLLQRYKRKSFLHRIVTSDEKWIYLENPKRKKSWVSPGEASTSTARPNRFGRKAMLCVWWDQTGVIYFELLKPGETVNAVRYQQQINDLSRAIAENRPEYQERQKRVILLHDNASSHKSKVVRDTVENLQWEVLHHAAYSPDLAPSDYYLFASLGHALSERRFDSNENLQKWLTEWFTTKDSQFYWRGIHKLPERWQKCVENDGKYFE